MNKAILALCLAACATTAAHAQELVTNGGFETGSFTGWTQFGETLYNGVDGGQPNTGTYAAYFGPVTTGGIQQTLGAVTGDVLQVSFWYSTDFGDTPNSILVTVGGVQVAAINDNSSTTYQQFTGQVTVTQDAPVLQLTFSDPSDYVEMDDISVTLMSHGGPTCGSADFNCDGDTATDADIEAFFACIAGNCPPAPCTSTADFNGDGDSATDADIEAFFRVLAGGTC